MTDKVSSGWPERAFSGSLGQSSVRPATPWSRRKVLGTAAGGLALAAGAGLFTPALGQGKKLTYWGGLIFSEDAN